MYRTTALVVTATIAVIAISGFVTLTRPAADLGFAASATIDTRTLHVPPRLCLLAPADPKLDDARHLGALIDADPTWSAAADDLSAIAIACPDARAVRRGRAAETPGELLALGPDATLARALQLYPTADAVEVFGRELERKLDATLEALEADRRIRASGRHLVRAGNETLRLQLDYVDAATNDHVTVFEHYLATADGGAWRLRWVHRNLPAHRHDNAARAAADLAVDWRRGDAR